MPWRVLLVLALLAGTASAQPILIPWRPPAGCTDGQAIVYDTTTKLWQCGSAGITNAAGNNAIPKSDGTNLVASSATDNGTTFAINTNKFTVTESSGNTSIAGTLSVTGLVTLTGGFTLGADSSAGSHKITSLANGTASSDAAAFGQIASAINTAISGTSGRSARLTGSNTIGTGAFTDDGTNATAQGALATLGNFTAGDDTADVFDFNGTLAKFGSASDGALYIHNNIISAGYATNGLAELAFNFLGYNDGTTQFRNTVVYDGKGAQVCKFDGALKTLNCIGGLQVNGTNVATTSNISGTVGRSARITAANTVGTGAFTDDGTNASIAGNLIVAADNKYIGIDNASPSGLGLVKKSASTPAIAYANNISLNFVKSSGVDVDPATRTFTTVGSFDASGNFNVSNAATITGLLTATAGVTTPANLTTTGTGDVVSGDDLTVADDSTLSGDLGVTGATTLAALTANGDVTFGDAAGDAFDFNGTYAKFGGTRDGGIYMAGASVASLNFEYASNAADSGYINRIGYAGGTTQFRNLHIQDGKAADVLVLTGSSKAAEFFGAADFDSTVNVDGNADFNAGVAVDGYFDALGDTITLGNAVTDEVYLQGAVVTHVTYTGTDPSLSSCGTGATITGSDERGIITTGTGATSCTLTFASTYVSTPACTFTLQYTGTPTGELFISSASASAVTVTSPDIDQSEGSPKIHYHCDGI